MTRVDSVIFIALAILQIAVPAASWAKTKTAGATKVVTSGKAVYYSTKNAFFLVHPSNSYDTAHASEDTTRLLVDAINKFNATGPAPVISNFFFIDDFAAIGDYFWQDLKPFTAVISDGGQHALHFRNLRRVIIAGGVFDFCLCRAVRDLLLHVPHLQGVAPVAPEIIFVQDAIYINNNYTSAPWADAKTETSSLLSITKKMSDLQLVNYVRDAYFGSPQTGICKSYGDTKFPGAKLLGLLNFEIDRDGVKLGEVGNAAGRTVKFNFSQEKSIEQNLANY